MITFEHVMLIAMTAVVTWFIAKCETQHYIKHRLRWWWNHDLNRWLDHRLDDFDKWVTNMTPKKWYRLAMGLVLGVYTPIIIWNFLAGSYLPFATLVCVEIGMIAVITKSYLTIKNKPKVTA